MNLRPSQILKKFFFNSKCAVCGKEVEDDEIYLCKKCKKEIEDKKMLHRRKNIYYLFDYKKDIRNLIIDYKLNGRKDISLFISGLIADDLKKIIKENSIDIVVPIPVSKERYFSRGFNQVELILDEIGITYKKAERRKNTLPMHGILDKNLRKINIKSAFKCDFETSKKNILIVDDIVTTGATIFEMINAIKKNGEPKEIYIFALSVASTFYKSM